MKKVNKVTLIISTSYLVLNSITMYIACSICVYVLNVSYTSLLMSGVLKTLITCISVILPTAILSYVIVYLKRVRNIKELVPFVIINIFSVLIISIFFLNFHKEFDNQLKVILLLSIVIQTVILNYIFIKINLYHIEDKEKDLIKLSSNYNMKLMEDIKKEQDQMNVLKHDLKNQLFILESLVDNEDAIKYVNEIKQEYNENENLINSGNVFVDACLNAKIPMYKGINIKVSAVLKDTIKMKEKDLCSLIFNLLDNAVDAATKTKEKEVTLKLLQENNTLIIQCSNSCDEEPTLISNKGKGHGYGIRIIDNIVNKYQGEIKREYLDDKFYTNIYFVLM